jgi:hypothetical protein
MLGAQFVQTTTLNPFRQLRFGRAPHCPFRHALDRVRLQVQRVMGSAAEPAENSLAEGQLAVIQPLVAGLVEVTTAL